MSRSAWRELPWLASACVVFWWVRIWQNAGQRIELFVNFDALMYWLPLLREAALQWRAHAPPLWNPYQAFGTPLLATQQVAALYPLNALYLVLDPGSAWLATGLAHHLIAAAGTYAFCRVLGLSRDGALVGAASYAFSAVIIEKYIDLPDEFICLTWLPAMFACAEWLLRQPALGRTVLLTLVWTLHVLGGDADTIARSALLLGAYVAVHIAQQAWGVPRQAVRAGVAATLAAVLTLGLTAPQWLPTLELVQHSVRALGSLSAAQQSGFPADPRLLVSSHIRGIPTLGIGSTLPLILALVGMILWPRRLQAWFFALAGALVVMLAMGAGTPLFAVARQLPTGTWFRAPLRFLNLWPLCVAVLAAAGVEALVEGGHESVWRRRWGALLASGVLVSASQTWATVDSGKSAMWFAGVGLTLMSWSVTSLTLMATRRRTAGRHAGTALIVLLICAVPTVLLQPEILSPHRVAEAYGSEAAVFAELGRYAPARVLSLLPVVDGRSWAKLGTYFEVPVLNDFEPLTLGDFQTFTEALRGRNSQSVRLPEALDVFTGDPVPPHGMYNAALLNLSGVRFVVAAAANAADIAQWFGPGVSLVPWRRWGSVVVYENADALPRTFFIPAEAARAAGRDCVQALAGGAVDGRKELLLEDASAVAAGPRVASAAIVSMRNYSPSAVEIAVTTDVAGYIVLTDAFYPGWSARVDGGESRIVRADCFFRAVAVPAGAHVVTFSYAPRSFGLGVALSVVAGALAATLLALGRSRSATDKARFT